MLDGLVDTCASEVRVPKHLAKSAIKIGLRMPPPSYLTGLPLRVRRCRHGLRGVPEASTSYRLAAVMS